MDNITYMYVEPKKYNKLVNITKKQQTHRHREQTTGYQWREVEGADGGRRLRD